MTETESDLNFLVARNNPTAKWPWISNEFIDYFLHSLFNDAISTEDVIKRLMILEGDY
jgi:hypothetical protein